MIQEHATHTRTHARTLSADALQQPVNMFCEGNVDFSAVFFLLFSPFFLYLCTNSAYLHVKCKASVHPVCVCVCARALLLSTASHFSAYPALHAGLVLPLKETCGSGVN